MASTNSLASLNSKLLATGKRPTSIKARQTVSNESIDLTMILFIYGCFFVLMFIILILNADYTNLDKYRRFSGDPQTMGLIDRLKSWFLCNQNCKLRYDTETTIPGATQNAMPPGFNSKGQCWSN